MSNYRVAHGCYAVLVVALVAGCQSGDSTKVATPAPDAALFPVSQDGMWGFIDAAGTLVVEARFDRAWPFSEGRALVKIGERYGYIDRTGDLVVAAIYTDAWYFSNGLAPVEKDGKWVYIDTSGSVKVEPDFQLQASFLEENGVPRPELGRVRVGDQYGYVNKVGELVIEPQYNQAWYFVDGMARVKIEGKWGFIRPDGKLAVEPQFDLAWDFSHGVARVQIDGKQGYIDRTGKYIWAPTN